VRGASGRLLYQSQRQDVTRRLLDAVPFETLFKVGYFPLYFSSRT